MVGYLLTSSRPARYAASRTTAPISDTTNPMPSPRWQVLQRFIGPGWFNVAGLFYLGQEKGVHSSLIEMACPLPCEDLAAQEARYLLATKPSTIANCEPLICLHESPNGAPASASKPSPVDLFPAPLLSRLGTRDSTLSIFPGSWSFQPMASFSISS